MSVEKMEKYKEYKKHRKEILRKQKRQEKIRIAIASLVCVVILGGLGFLVYQDVKPEVKGDWESLIDWSQYIKDEEEDEETSEDNQSSDASDEEEVTADSEDGAAE